MSSTTTNPQADKAASASKSDEGSRRVRLVLSPQAEKYARKDSPVSARRMAARGALPLEPIDLATVLFALMHDPDAEVKTTARESLESLPEHVLDPVLAGPANPALLAFLARTHKDHEARCEAIALNAAADDATVAFLAGLPFRRVVDIVSNNQQRMMRCEAIVDALGANPLTGRAVIERILNFLGMLDESGESSEEWLDEEDFDANDAEQAVLALVGDELADVAQALASEDHADDEDEELKGNLFGAIQNMTVMQKIKLARMGGAEARGILIRDRNKVVAVSAISSPKITDSEVVGFAQSRGVSDEVLRIISTNRDWTRNYQVKLALVGNPKTPQGSAVKFLNYLQDKDLKTLMKSKDVPSVISIQARRILQKKGKI